MGSNSLVTSVAHVSLCSDFHDPLVLVHCAVKLTGELIRPTVGAGCPTEAVEVFDARLLDGSARLRLDFGSD